MTLAKADVHNWLIDITGTTRTIDSLVADGFHGFSIADLLPWLDDAHVRKRFDAISWLKTSPDSSGDPALMTANEQSLDELLEWMLKERGECPMVYGPEEDVLIPDGAPLLRPTAYNLPDGLCSEDVLQGELLSLFEMIFADMKEIYGNQAHLYRIDYGCFMHHMETQGGVVFTGEFIDLDSREIHTFTMDSIQQRLRHHSTGRFLDGNSQSEDEGTR